MKIKCFIGGLLLAYSIAALAEQKVILTPMEHYDWSEVMVAPQTVYEGNQVLHFGSKNKPYQNDSEAEKFVATHLKQAKMFQSDADVLRYASDKISINNGFILEMGVATGKTINFLAALNPTKKVYGFDSFQGLPKDWTRKDTQKFTRGMFAFRSKQVALPVIKNVVLYKGLFSEVLPLFKDQIIQIMPIALLHIDSDIYESAKDVFDTLGENIVPGTIIVFDEFYNYGGYENHEFKAFQEFIQQRGLKVKYLAYNGIHEQVAVQII